MAGVLVIAIATGSGPLNAAGPDSRSGAAVTDRTSTASGGQARPVGAVAPERLLKRIRAGVAERRQATWRWQAQLGYARTRTAYRERASHSVAYLRWIRSLWTLRADHHWREFVEIRDDPVAAIRHVFGAYADEAVGVAECESHLDVTAGVGKHQYLGLFQMGSSERALFGHGWSALEQARAAFRYFVSSGRDWSPWSCRWAAR